MQGKERFCFVFLLYFWYLSTISYSWNNSAVTPWHFLAIHFQILCWQPPPWHSSFSFLPKRIDYGGLASLRTVADEHPNLVAAGCRRSSLAMQKSVWQSRRPDLVWWEACICPTMNWRYLRGIVVNAFMASYFPAKLDSSTGWWLEIRTMLMARKAVPMSGQGHC